MFSRAELFADRAATAAAVRRNLSSLLTASIHAATKSNKWRDREAAVLAIADIVGHGGGGGGGGEVAAPTTDGTSSVASGSSSWRRLGPFIEILWQTALAALDDVKDSVKTAAFVLAKQLLSLTKRFVDPTKARNEGEVKEAVRRLLPLLLRASTSTTSTVESDDEEFDDDDGDDDDKDKHDGGGIVHVIELALARERSVGSRDRSVVVMSPEGRAVATAALVSVVDAAGPALRPFAAKVVITVCSAVSELEPNMLPYLQFHTDGLANNSVRGGGGGSGSGGSGGALSSSSTSASSFVGLEEVRLSLAKQGPLATALRNALALASDRRVAARILHPLFSLLRRGVGLATRATCAQVVDELCERCPEALRTPLTRSGTGGDQEVPARKLLFLLSELVLSERSPTIRRAFTNSLATVAKVLSTPSPFSLIS